MPFEALLNEVEHLHGVSTRLEGLSEQHPSVAEALIAIAAGVRNSAVVLAVLVAMKNPEPT